MTEDTNYFTHAAVYEDGSHHALKDVSQQLRTFKWLKLSLVEFEVRSK